MPYSKNRQLPTRRAKSTDSKQRRGNGTSGNKDEDPASVAKSRKFGIQLPTRKTPPPPGEFEDDAAYWKAYKESLGDNDEGDKKSDTAEQEGNDDTGGERREHRAAQKNVSKKAAMATFHAQYEKDRNSLQSPDFTFDIAGDKSEVSARNSFGGRVKNINSARNFRARRRKLKNSPMEASVALFSPSEESNVSTAAGTLASTPLSTRTSHSFPLSANQGEDDTNVSKSGTPMSDLKARVLLQGINSVVRPGVTKLLSVTEDEEVMEEDKGSKIEFPEKNGDPNEEESSYKDVHLLDIEAGPDSNTSIDDDEILAELQNDRSTASHTDALSPLHTGDKDLKESNNKQSRKDDSELSDDEIVLKQQEPETRRVDSSLKPLHEQGKYVPEEEGSVTKDETINEIETDMEGDKVVHESSKSRFVDARTKEVTPDERQRKRRSHKRVTYARDAYGYQADNRSYKTIPLQDFVESDDNENEQTLRRSTRVKVTPLAFWKNEKFIYEPQNETGRLGRALGNMPVVSGICKALPTPYKKRKLHHDDNGGERKRARKSSSTETIQNFVEKLEPFDSKKLQKKYKYSDDQYANTWHEPTQQVELKKLITRKEEMQGVDLPRGKRSKGESSIVGKAAQAFNIKAEIPTMPGYIMGNLILPPQGIKDQEGVGSCSQGFNVGDCQPQSLEVAIADPDINDGKFDAPTAQRFLLSKGDMFHIPAGNVYRIQNHSKTHECTLYWTIIRPFKTNQKNEP